MGLFGRKPARKVEPVGTELDQGWFYAWAEGIRQKKGLPQDADWLADTYLKAANVIDHDTRPYVETYCDQWAQLAYVDYYGSADMTPWGLVSVTVGCNPDRLSEWQPFIVDDMKAKLGRFAEIFVDPSIVE